LKDERLIVASLEFGRPVVPKGAGKEIPVRAVLMSAARPDEVWKMRSENRVTVHLRPEPLLRLSSLSMVRDGVLAGAGAALLPKMLVADDIAEGRLVQWGKQDGPPAEIWALHSSRRLVSVKVRALFEVLQQTFPKKVFSALR
jgi:DNA-binding transcriptional LysR family regulator